MSDYLLSDETPISEIALEISGRLGTGEYTRDLDEFLVKYSKYEKYRTGLARELRWATAACAVAACCGDSNAIVKAEDVAACVESVIGKAAGDNAEKSRKKGERCIPSRSRIQEYLKVLIYVKANAGRLCGSEDHSIHSSLRSVAYLVVTSSIKGSASAGEEFSDAAQLLNELVHPILLATFQEFLNPFKERSFHTFISDQGLYAT